MPQAEYVRDMHNNYIVLEGMEGKVSVYGTRMLLNNTIPGLLKMELRCIDQMDLFYYDITSKKSVASVCGNKSLNYDELRKILSQIIEAIEKSREYLLLEDDFIIEPDYVFIDDDSKDIELCHLVGREENIREQLSKFMEFLMNKVDYKDEDAVVLIYAMYKESKEPDCTFDKLKKELNNKNRKTNRKKNTTVNEGHTESLKELKQTDNKDKNKSGKQKNQKDKQQENKPQNQVLHNQNASNKKLRNQYSDHSGGSFFYSDILSRFQDYINYCLGRKNQVAKMPYTAVSMQEEIESEREIYYYGRKTYLLAGLSFLCGIIIFLLAIQLKLMHNSFGTHIDNIKLFSCILVIGCAEAYVLVKLFDTKYKLTKIKTEVDYIEPGQEIGSGDIDKTISKIQGQGEPRLNQSDINQSYGNPDAINTCNINRYAVSEDGTRILWTDNHDSEQNKTEILAPLLPPVGYELIKDNNGEEEKVPVERFPFIIGKLTEGIDLTIEDRSVSRRHARLTNQDGNIFLMDLNSTNGTFLNGMKMDENKLYLISDMDEISFSQVKYIWKVNRKAI